MPDREKVIKGLQAHADGCGYRSHHCDEMECPYRYSDESCDIEEMCRDALTLLKEQGSIISALKSDLHETLEVVSGRLNVVRCKDCKYCDCGSCLINIRPREVKPDFFCADGRRKE